MNAQLKLIKPTNQNRSVHPTRPPNADLRTREHLLPAEIDKLMAAARNQSRYPDRDATLIETAGPKQQKTQMCADGVQMNRKGLHLHKKCLFGTAFLNNADKADVCARLTEEAKGHTHREKGNRRARSDRFWPQPHPDLQSQLTGRDEQTNNKQTTQRC